MIGTKIITSAVLWHAEEKQGETRERMTGILPPVAHQASINTLERHWGQKEGRNREREKEKETESS